MGKSKLEFCGVRKGFLLSKQTKTREKWCYGTKISGKGIAVSIFFGTFAAAFRIV